jgi:pimeloyl-ACP methyl ester carboxylesterase
MTSAQVGANAVTPDKPNIVLVHGAWADGSSWAGVIERLQADGYKVTAPQFPLSALAGDVARLRQVLAAQEGPTIVAGHSYGGQIMTALGTDAPNVVGLVYIAAFGLDEGESLGALLEQGPPAPATAHLVIDDQGFAWLPEDDFVSHFAADVDPVKAKVMYAVQQPLLAAAFGEVMGEPAWKALPSWYMVATEDEAIPPAAERQLAERMGASTVEVPSSHVPMVSHPDEVSGLILDASAAVRRDAVLSVS